MCRSIRFGLCCIFRDAPITFRRTTAKHLMGLPRKAQLEKIESICLHNAHSLMAALSFCKAHGIGAFRINSQILPLKTHPDVGYDMRDLPGGPAVVDVFRECGRFSRRYDIRTTFHPDQFIVLNSPSPDVVARSTADLIYQAQVAQWVNADVINIHGGGAYGDKPAALARLVKNIGGLPAEVRKRLTLENDDRTFTSRELLPVCREAGVPLVYDVHHHRCLPDGLSIAEATRQASATWDREPLFHLSSPLSAWGTGDSRPHHDYIDPMDFPCEWRHLKATIEIEAKAKELAVEKLAAELPGHLRKHCKNQKRAKT